MFAIAVDTSGEGTMTALPLAENVTNVDGRVIFKEYVESNPGSLSTLFAWTHKRWAIQSTK